MSLAIAQLVRKVRAETKLWVNTKFVTLPRFLTTTNQDALIDELANRDPSLTEIITQQSV